MGCAGEAAGEQIGIGGYWARFKHCPPDATDAVLKRLETAMNNIYQTQTLPHQLAVLRAEVRALADASISNRENVAAASQHAQARGLLELAFAQTGQAAPAPLQALASPSTGLPTGTTKKDISAALKIYVGMLQAAINLGVTLPSSDPDPVVCYYLSHDSFRGLVEKHRQYFPPGVRLDQRALTGTGLTDSLPWLVPYHKALSQWHRTNNAFAKHWKLTPVYSTGQMSMVDLTTADWAKMQAAAGGDADVSRNFVEVFSEWPKRRWWRARLQTDGRGVRRFYMTVKLTTRNTHPLHTSIIYR
jgi:hypothetical protein